MPDQAPELQGSERKARPLPSRPPAYVEEETPVESLPDPASTLAQAIQKLLDDTKADRIEIKSKKPDFKYELRMNADELKLISPTVKIECKFKQDASFFLNGYPEQPSFGTTVVKYLTELTDLVESGKVEMKVFPKENGASCS